jgi:hypothetical protein
MILRRVFLSLICLAAPALAATISYVPQTSTTISPGGTITVSIYGSSLDTIAGYSLYLESSATGSFIQVASQTINTTLFTYGGPGPTLPETISATSSSHDLGAFSLSPLAANTTWQLGTVTFSVSNLTPLGSYTIGNTAGSLFTPNFFDSDPVTLASFNISVIPEPSAWSVLIAGGLASAIAVRKISRHHQRT